MPLAASALTGRVPAGHMSLHQRSPQNVGHRWKLFGQTLPPLAEGQFGKPVQSATCLHLSASLHQNRPLVEDANLPGCEFPPTSLIQKEIELLCEVAALSSPLARMLLYANVVRRFFLPSVLLLYNSSVLERDDAVGFVAEHCIVRGQQDRKALLH